MDQIFEQHGQWLSEKHGGRLRPKNFLRKAKRLSPDETPVSFVLASSIVACTYPYIRLIADLCFSLPYQAVLLKIIVANIQMVDQCLR